MKVLHLETGMNLYGGALQVFYLLRGLQGTGIENILVGPRGSEICQKSAPFARVVPLPMRGELDVSFGLELIRLLRREKPDVLHVHSRRGADLWGALAARITGTRAILTRRVDNPEPAWLARFKYRQFSHVAAISEGIRQVLLKEGVPADHVSCIHSAVDLEAWQQPRDREWFLKEFGVGPQEKAIGVIAQLIPRKGHRYLIEAAPAILKEFPRTRFIFLGKGSLRNELEELVKDRGVAERFLFAGFRDDLQRIMPCLDLVVHPAQMEGLGVSLLQASAAAVPVVASRAGGIPEIVRDGINGYLVEPGRADVLIAPVLDLLLNPGKTRTLGENGLSLVREEFSIAAMVTSYIELYSCAAPLQKGPELNPLRLTGLREGSSDRL